MSSENKQNLSGDMPNYYDHTPAHSAYNDHVIPTEYPVEHQYQQQEQQQQEPATSQRLKRASTLGRRFHKVAVMAGAPLNKAANAVGSEGWWPSSMEKECNKAARILYSFTDLGIATPPKSSGPFHPTGLSRKAIVKIPQQALQNCAGLAIFNVIRAGAFHGSLAGGSGLVVARRPDGSWSPPSAFVVSSLGAGFVFGLDIYDCVCVLNTPAQVAAFTRPRLSLGGDAAVAIGPVGTGTSVQAALTSTGSPVWSYMKNRGLWAGIQVDGTIIVSRPDANAAFHKSPGISAKTILQGDVSWPAGARHLFQVLMAAEGRGVVDETFIRETDIYTPPPPQAAPVAALPPPIYADDDKVDPAVAGAEYESAVDEKKRLEAAGY